MNRQDIITEQIKFIRSLLADGTLKVTKEFRIDDVNTSLNKIEKSLTTEPQLDKVTAYNEKLLKQPSVQKPTYHIGIDTYDKKALTYGLVKKQGDNFEVLLLKTVEDKNKFDGDVEALSKLFNAETIKETDTPSSLKKYFRETSFKVNLLKTPIDQLILDALNSENPYLSTLNLYKAWIENKKELPNQKEIINKLIKSIFIIPSNFEYCAKNVHINGTLREEIERILIEFKNTILEK